MADTPCIDISLPSLPTIPPLLLPSVALITPFPIGLPLPCCKFKIAAPGIDAAIVAVNSALAAAIAAGGAPFIATIAQVNKALAVVQKQVNKARLRIPACPCNGTTITP